MAVITKEGLNAAGMRLTIFCGGFNAVGIGVAGTWVGTLQFLFSTDGVNFYPAFVTPFASGTNVSSTTANGNWFIPAQNYVAIQVYFSARTSGTPLVTLAAAVDSSWQDAFLAATSIYVNQQSGTNSTNTMTIAAQANRAWKLRSLVVSVDGTATWGATPVVTVSDGGSSTLFSTDLATTAGFYEIPLPSDNGTYGTPMKGVVGTPGNSMVITAAAAGSGRKTIINAEMHAA